MYDVQLQVTKTDVVSVNCNEEKKNKKQIIVVRLANAIRHNQCVFCKVEIKFIKFHCPGMTVFLSYAASSWTVATCNLRSGSAVCVIGCGNFYLMSWYMDENFRSC